MNLRGSFKNVVNHRDVPLTAEKYFDDYDFKCAPVAAALGAKGLGFHVETLPPGKLGCPLHYHHQEEELFFVLAGEMTLRQGQERDGKLMDEERIPVRAGDFVSFPAGTRIAHQFINESAADCVFIALCRREPTEICEYPDSNKVMHRCTPTGARSIFVRSDRKDYWVGEEHPLKQR